MSEAADPRCAPPAPPERSRRSGVDANARLTASTSVILTVLLAVEGVTLVSLRSLLDVHVFVGALLIPPVAIKMASTAYRFARYYSGDPAYRSKGPPPWLLRLLGPAVVALTVVVFASGVALLWAGPGWHARLLSVHKASFVAWFAVTTIHVLGHLRDSATLGLPDWTRRRIRGGALRRAVLVASLALGAVGGAVLVGRIGPYLAAFASRLGR